MTNAQYVFASAVVFSAAIVLHGMLGKGAQSVVNQGMDARRYEKFCYQDDQAADGSIEKFAILDTQSGRIYTLVVLCGKDGVYRTINVHDLPNGDEEKIYTKRSNNSSR